MYKDSSERPEHRNAFQTSNVIQNGKFIWETVLLMINLYLVQEKNSTNLLNHFRIQSTFKSGSKFKRKELVSIIFAFMASYDITSSADFNILLKDLECFCANSRLKTHSPRITINAKQLS